MGRVLKGKSLGFKNVSARLFGTKFNDAGLMEFLLGTVSKLCRNGEKEYFSIFGRREDISL